MLVACYFVHMRFLETLMSVTRRHHVDVSTQRFNSPPIKAFLERVNNKNLISISSFDKKHYVFLISIHILEGL